MQPTPQTLYIGIIVREDVADVVSTGTDHKKVYESTEQAWYELGELIGQENASFTVTETPMPTPVEPPLPEWYLEAITHFSPSAMANHILQGWDMDCLMSNAHFHLEKNYEDPAEYRRCLELFILQELTTEKGSNGQYDPEFLEDLAEENDRDIQEYTDNDTLVLLDAIRANL